MFKRFPVLLAGGLAGLAIALPVGAADKLFYKTGSLVRSVEVQSLEQFAADGTVASDLGFIFRVTNVDAATQASYQEELTRTIPIDSDLLSRFLYTPIGESLLTEVGHIFQTRGGNNGGLSLRAAIVRTAEENDGISLIDTFRYLPTDMQIDLDQAQALANQVEKVIQLTQESVQEMANLSAAEAVAEPAVDYSSLRDLTQPGPYGFSDRRITVTDPSRQGDATSEPRSFYIEIYQPRTWPSGSIPVVVFSHGLTAAPGSRKELAEHLASYGYLVVLPQHPGSDQIQFEHFQQGLSNNLFFIDEFINRPLDISFTLDELERLNSSEFDGRLNLEQVAVMGHSFGGYTALAVGGATFDFDYLAKTCDRPFALVNTSLLLQCQALRLPHENYNFRDPRVTAVAVLNPVNSAIFGPQGLAQVQVPIMVGAGSHDPATPAVFEQFQTFPWLGSTDKTLLLLEGQAHVDTSALDAGALQLFGSLPNLTLASSELINTYLETYMLAFLECYLRRNLEYRLYLRASYAAYLSADQEFKLYAISPTSEADLVTPIEQQLIEQQLIEQ